jgi:hypothetical protein
VTQAVEAPRERACRFSREQERERERQQ